MEISDAQAAADLMRGLECWHVNAGGGAGSSFSLAFGGKVARAMPLKNPAVGDDFRRHEGEANLYVWCSWRLEDEQNVLASCQQEADAISTELGRLEGKVLDGVRVLSKGLDLALQFGQYRLVLFCDCVDSESCSSGNWELVVRDTVHRAGPGFLFETEKRSPPW